MRMCLKWLYIFRQMTDSSHWLFFSFHFNFYPFPHYSLSFFLCSCHCRFISLYKGPCHTHKVQRLNESTSYTFRIQAFNEAGEGPFSNVYMFTTLRSPPVPMKGTVAAFFSSSLFLLILFCYHKPDVDQLLSLRTPRADTQTSTTLCF